MERDGDQAEIKNTLEPAPDSAKVLRHERFCPNCSAELKENHCKLICPVCGFYLSCSDFY
jgi:Zn finger protein HypA/HybF involved in hydrogenase expression